MRFIRLQPHNSLDSGERGSQVVGFALVAPVLISVALLLLQVVGIVICKVSISAATGSATHLAALKGSSVVEVKRLAHNYWIPSGFQDCGHTTSIKRTKSFEVNFVVIRSEQCLDVPLLKRQVSLVSFARELDEGKL